MFFKTYLNGLAETLDIKYRSSLRQGINSADIGELCELFIKEFLLDYLDDHFRIFRGGNIVNIAGMRSPQLDVVLTNKSALKIFGDKGIYPIETVAAVFSITSNLTVPKLIKCIKELGKIPKSHYHFGFEKFYGDDFKKQTMDAWRHVIPYSCIFGFTGKIDSKVIHKINDHLLETTDHSLWPSIIIVNRKGMLEKEIEKSKEGKIKIQYTFTKFDSKEVWGVCFSKILFHLYNASKEQNYMMPNYGKYFAQDY